jgi:glycosyltransferase involved in cell wall biosynthesis
MIVKDEARVIRRCLESVRGVIDGWVIADTGSTDGTQGVIREALGDVPGRLIERPWVDFSHNRNEVLECARREFASDYTLLMDADDVLEVGPGLREFRFDADAYDVELAVETVRYRRRVMVRSALPWRYEGVLHEYIHCPEPFRQVDLSSGLARVRAGHEGARSRDPLTYRRDALVLERALLEEPGNVRNVFYLAQSYRDAGDFELALRHYRRRAEMGGWQEEVWYSHYQAAAILERMGRPWPEVMEAYLETFERDPSRAEPLYWIGRHYQGQKAFHSARTFFGRALKVASPASHKLFVDRTIYDYLLPLEYAVTCYYTGDHAEAVSVNDRLLASGRLPEGLVDQVRRNRQFSVDALASEVASGGVNLEGMACV